VGGERALHVAPVDELVDLPSESQVMSPSTGVVRRRLVEAVDRQSREELLDSQLSGIDWKSEKLTK